MQDTLPVLYLSTVLLRTAVMPHELVRLANAGSLPYYAAAHAHPLTSHLPIHAARRVLPDVCRDCIVFARACAE